MKTPALKLLQRATSRLIDAQADEALTVRLTALLRSVARLNVTPNELRRCADYLENGSRQLAELLGTDDEGY